MSLRKYLSLLVAFIIVTETSYIFYTKYDSIFANKLMQNVVNNDPEAVNGNILNRSSFTGEYEFSGTLKPLRMSVIKTPSIANKYSVYVKHVHIGNCSQEVEEGDVLVEFDCPQLEHKIEATKNTMEQKMEYYNRIKKQKMEHVVSSYDLLKAEKEYKAAHYEYLIVVEEWKSLTIQSEFAGIASIPKVHEGELVTAGKEIMKVMDNKNIIIDISVSFDEYFNIGEYGKGVRICNDNNTATASGYIVGLEASFGSGLYNIRIKINDSYDYDAFRIGMQARIHVPKNTIYDVYVVPRGIVIENESGTYMCKLERKLDNFYTKIIPVEILDSNSSCYAVGSRYINDGDIVAYEGIIKRDNVLVEIKEFFS